ncbi:MAG TPA: hypothetical protein V6D47_20855 [Oscillatoriaceae cyanobacterium]
MLLITGLVGCSLSTPLTRPKDVTINQVSDLNATSVANHGRILGTVATTPEELQWVGVSSVAGSKAQAFDANGVALGDAVDIDGQGHFILSDLAPSRPRIYIEADIHGLRFRACTAAPQQSQDYSVVLDPATTYLADELRYADANHYVPLGNLSETSVVQTAQVVKAFMTTNDDKRVVQQTDGDLNAYAFSHFMDDNYPVKVAVYSLSPALLRGWKPTPAPIITAPPATATAEPTATPTATASCTDTATGPACPDQGH